MATIVQAKNSDNVQTAIEAVALPSGSASIKRNPYFDLALNAYVGGFYGREKDNSSEFSLSIYTIAGINAPIGIAFSTSCDPKVQWQKWKWGLIPAFWWWPACTRILSSTTIFLSIIDIGAVTAYRFQNDSVSTLPDFKWQNILAPGAQVILGVKNLPLSVGTVGNSDHSFAA